MTDHTATWSEEYYYSNDDTPTTGDHTDEEMEDHPGGHYWDFEDNS